MNGTMAFRGTLALAALLFSGSAEAQISRVFVSVNGNDANTCSNIATPCRTLGGGITQVDAQGEVIVIGSGSYAGATITKAVKINVAAGAVAFSGLPFVVNPGPSDTVVLRGLTLKSATPGSGIGINHQSGILLLENLVLDGWNEGLVSQSGATRLLVKGSVFRNQAFSGIHVQLGGTASVAVDESFFEGNGVLGLFLRGGTGRVSNSSITGNSTGAGTLAAGTQFTFQRCEVSGNGYAGLDAQGSSILRVGESVVSENGFGVRRFNSGATLETFRNNVIRGNTTNTSGTITPVTLQ